jgi:hypothetical protein
MHEFLKNKSEPALNEEVLKLLKETRQTQSTLMRILWVAMGFVFGMLAMQWLFQVA